MRALFSRTLVIHVSSPLRSSVVLFHSGAGEDAYRRRTEPHNPLSSPSHLYTSSASLRRNYDDENRSVKVNVWWDFENCQVPVGVNVERVPNRITAALRSTGIKGPITITAFGDVAQMSRATQEALTSTGVCLNHVPHRGKNSSDRSFMADLVYWVTQNPPPAHFFLISGDKDFANILHRLRMSNYNILLASNDLATGVLCSAATVMWPWTELVKGDNVTAKHFNHPPDGFHGSWYGHYKGALDDPFKGSELYAASLAEESMEPISETKIRPIPRVVVNGIRNVLHSYPEGMYISELRAGLRRRNISFDKDLYGYKKFSDLLASMSSIVKFIPNPSGDGQPLIADKRLMESVDISSKLYNESVDLRSKSTKEANSNVEKNHSISQDVKPLPMAIPDNAVVRVGVTKPISEYVSVVVPEPKPTHDVVAKGVGTTGSTSSDKGHHAEIKDGIFKRIWTTLSGRGSGHLAPIDKNVVMSEGTCTSTEQSVKSDVPKKLALEEKSELQKINSSYIPSSSNSFSNEKLVSDENSTVQSKKQNDMPKVRMGFFSKLANWWKSGNSGIKDQGVIFDNVGKQMEADGNEKQVKDVNPVSLHSETPALFSRSHFWDALESFLLTSKGSDIILKSNTRCQLAYKLQTEGPCILKDINESQIFKLVEVLISEKRWVDENASVTFPFKLALPAKRKFASSNNHCSNGLSSLFSARTPQSSSEVKPDNLGSWSVEAKPPHNIAELKAWFHINCNDTEDIKPEDFQKLFEGKFNRKLVCSYYGYPTIRSLLFACVADVNFNQERKKRPPSKEETLSDCCKLLMDLFKENPGGFNMNIFRPAFLQKYGYVLDCQTLGYPKLASLLQIMPGAKVESSFVLPAVLLGSDSGLVTRKAFSDGLDSEGPSNGEDWEELGPVSDDKGHAGDGQVSYSKVSLSDEEFTDSDDEASDDFDGSKKRTKLGEQYSSLMQILDSWYGSKEGGGRKDQGHSADEVEDSSISKHKNTSDVRLSDYPNMRLRPHNRYSFVKDSEDNEKDKLVDNILGSLKKAGDARLRG